MNSPIPPDLAQPRKSPDTRDSWPAKINHVPKDIFVDPEIFDLELKRIFYGNEWLLVGHESEIPNKHDFKTFSIGHVPLIINRDSDGEVHVFYNACSHRATQMETAAMGNRRTFECPYHRWSFSSKGELIGSPNRPGDYPDNFSRADYPLAKPRMAMVHGLIFVSFGDAPPPIEEYLSGWVDQIAEVMGGDGRLRLLGYQKVVFKANWKTFTDNDSYHAGLLHTAFRMLNWQGGRGWQTVDARGHRGYVSELSLPKSVELLKDPSLIDHRCGNNLMRGSVNVRFFPLSGLTRHMDSINIRFSNATAVDSTEVHYAYFARLDDTEEMVRQRIRQSSNLLGPCGMVSMEDAAVFHRVHIGSNTPGNAIFQKGIKDEYSMPSQFGQSDESSNLPLWERYRSIMGFERDVA